MKIIKRKATKEISEVVCDICKKEACSELKMEFGYGSTHDMEIIKGDFCEKHGNEFRNIILKKYPKIQPDFLYPP